MRRDLLGDGFVEAQQCGQVIEHDDGRAGHAEIRGFGKNQPQVVFPRTRAGERAGEEGGDIHWVCLSLAAGQLSAPPAGGEGNARRAGMNRPGVSGRVLRRGSIRIDDLPLRRIGRGGIRDPQKSRGFQRQVVGAENLLRHFLNDPLETALRRAASAREGERAPRAHPSP